MGFLFGDEGPKGGWRAPWERLVSYGNEGKCVQSGCCNTPTGSKIKTVGGWISACSSHKKAAGGERPKNVLKAAEQARIRKEKVDARRAQKEKETKGE